MIKDFNALLTLDIQFFADPEPAPAEPTEPAEPQATEPTSAEPQEKLLTQAEFEEALKKRLERERKKFADYDEIKTKATEYEKALEEKRLAELTEKERAEELAKKYEEELNAIKAELDATRTKAQQQAIKNEFIKVATSANIAYIDDAIALADLSAVNIDEDGKVVGVEDVVKALVENKPFLVAKKQSQPIGTATNGGQQVDKTADQLLAEAAEKARASGLAKDRAAYSKLKKQLGR